MSFVSAFKHDLFVSYAHFDNEEDAQGVCWVSRFQADLKNALRQRLGEDPEVFFDSQELRGERPRRFPVGECLSVGGLPRRVLAKLRRARLYDQGIAGILRARLRCRPGCHGRTVAGGGERSSPDAGRQRTPFWWKDQTEQDIPLRLTPKFNPEMYNERLQILAHQIKKILIELHGGGAHQTSAGETRRPRPQSAARCADAQGGIAGAGNRRSLRRM